MHQELGGRGWSPSHEEHGPGYDVEYIVEVVKVHPEAKGGGQIPQALVKFLGTEWYRRAIGQSERSLPYGSGAKPALWAHLPGGRKVLIVDFGGGRPTKEGARRAKEAEPVRTRRTPSG
jgi:hypothetical protein